MDKTTIGHEVEEKRPRRIRHSQGGFVIVEELRPCDCPRCRDREHWVRLAKTNQRAEVQRLIHGAELRIEYRAALASCADAGIGLAYREAGLLVRRRYLPDVQLRVAEGENHRLVMGVAVRYGDEAKIYGVRERIVKGALRMPTGPWNLTLQHDRAKPLSLGEFIEDGDALRFRAVLPEGARQDQALSDVKATLLRGASLEFVPLREREIEWSKEGGSLYDVLDAQVLRLSLVDDGAYPESKLSEPTKEPPAARPGDHEPRARRMLA